MPIIARARHAAASHHAKTGGAQGNQDNLPLIRVARTIAVRAAHPTETARMSAGRVKTGLTGIKAHARAPSSRVGARLRSETTINAGTTSPGRKAAKIAAAQTLTTPATGHQRAVMRAAATSNAMIGLNAASIVRAGHRAASRTMIASHAGMSATNDPGAPLRVASLARVDTIANSDRNTGQDDPTRVIHAGKAARSVSHPKPGRTNDRRANASSSKATTNSSMPVRRSPTSSRAVRKRNPAEALPANHAQNVPTSRRTRDSWPK